MTSWPMAFSVTLSMNSLTTWKLTSASSRAVRTSRIASRTFSSEMRPRPERLRKTPFNRSLSASSMWILALKTGFQATAVVRPEGWGVWSQAGIIRAARPGDDGAGFGWVFGSNAEDAEGGAEGGWLGEWSKH